MKTSHLIIGLIVIIGATLLLTNTTNNDTQKNTNNSQIETVADISENSGTVTDNVTEVDDTAGSYETWSKEKLALAETNDVVIFFHASWCPSCRGLNKDIEENLSSIPENIVILKADYDTETELKKEYGVTTQHTMVQVDAEGNLIKKWSGGSKLEDLVSEIQ